MATKYKVGDKVKVRKDLVVNAVYDHCLFTSSMQTFKGKICTIEAFFDDNAYKLKGSGYLWTEAMFEGLVENTKVDSFTKADLKSGMIVEYRNGKRNLVLGDRIIRENGWSPLFNFSNDLKHIHFSCYDIIKVYKSFDATSFSDLFDYAHLELIWEGNPGYNGKVVCVDANKTYCWTVGKIYQFTNGIVVDDNGIRYKFKSFEEFNKYSEAKWLEIVE